MAEFKISKHAYAVSEETQREFAKGIEEGGGWIYETQWLACRRCKKRFFEVLVMGQLDVPCVCGSCAYECTRDCAVDSINR